MAAEQQQQEQEQRPMRYGDLDDDDVRTSAAFRHYDALSSSVNGVVDARNKSDLFVRLAICAPAG